MKKLIIPLVIVFIAGIGYLLYRPSDRISPPLRSDVEKTENVLPPKEERVLARDFSFKDLDGKNYKLSDFKGKVIILNIRTTVCEACDIEVDFLRSLYYKEGTSESIKLIPVFEAESERIVSRYVEERGINFPVYLDRLGLSAYKYRVGNLPTSYIIDKNFKVVGGVVGVIDWGSNEVVSFLKQLADE